MKYALFIVLLVGVVACQKDKNTTENTREEASFYIPSNFPQPTYNFAANPITKEGVALGRKLFNDGLLSRDGTISCGSCHQQASGFTHHGHRLSHGIDDLLTLRNSLPIQNLAWQPSFFWDGGVLNLDLFAIAPIQAHNEMDETVENVLNKLRSTNDYPLLFEAAFGSTDINTSRFLKALAQYQLVCISANSKYDKYSRNEGTTLSTDELAGLALFRQKCATCHAGELFSDFSYRYNGLAIASALDSGRARINLDPTDSYKFRVPSLRNVVVTAPYMHDGRYGTLRDVLNFYSNNVQMRYNLDPALQQNGQVGIPLTDTEKDQLEAFLNTLTDTDFITDSRLSPY